MLLRLRLTLCYLLQTCLVYLVQSNFGFKLQMFHCTHLVWLLLHLSLFFQVKNLILAASAAVDSAPTTTSWAMRRSARTVMAETYCPCHKIQLLALLSTLRTALKQLVLLLPQHQLVQLLVLLTFIEFILFLSFIYPPALGLIVNW